jgi:hypothetical protein
MKLSIHVNDSSVYVDGFCHTDIDMSWVPDFDGTNVHAVQWYDDHGEIELVTLDPNIHITELGVFEQALTLWEEKHKEYLEELEKIRLREEEEDRLRQEEMIRQSQLVSDAVLDHAYEDDMDMYYNIEELLKEI